MKLHRGLITLVMFAAAASASAQSNPGRVAVVNGQTITQQELEKAAEADLKNLEMRRQQQEASLAQDKQQILTKALEELVSDKLLEAEAAKQKKTKAELLQAEVDSNVETPSENYEEHG